jgi:hypothetical protein
MSRSADSPTARINRALRHGCGVVERNNGHRILFDGRKGGAGMCGVVEINASGAFCQKRFVAHGFVKTHAKAGRLLHTDSGRDVWSPSRYQDTSFRNVEVGRR